MSRNSIALLSEIREKIAAAEAAMLIEENKMKWVKSWQGVDSETFSEPKTITWENVEEASRIVTDCEKRINSMNEIIWEGKDLIARINAFY